MIDQHLRLATLNDIPILLRFARNFHKVSPYRLMKFDEHKGRAFLKTIIESPLINGCCIIGLKNGEPIGFIVGVVEQPVFSSSRVAMELGWWIEEKHRKTRASVLIYSAYEDWAKRVGADYIQGAYLPGMSPDLDRFYEKRGYRQVESSFLKTLKFSNLELV